MITKKSRYYGLKEVTSVDAEGRLNTGLAFRRNEKVEGTISHQVQGGDRLDHLAYQYYRDSLHWWRIGDANMELATPLDITNRGPEGIFEATIRWQANQPLWHRLREQVSAIPGVSKVILGRDDMNSPERFLSVAENSDGSQVDPIGSIPASLAPELMMTVRSQQVGTELRDALLLQGIDLGENYRIFEINDSTWHIESLSSGSVWQLYQDGSDIMLQVMVKEFLWCIQITSNIYSGATSEALAVLEALGISMRGELVRQDLLGQALKIPTPKR